MLLMMEMSKVIHFVQNLSLDITLGAVISCAFIAQRLGVHLTLHMYLGLAIAIWLIYTIDHLIDAGKATKKPSNPRHAFHFQHRKMMLWVALGVFTLGLINAFFLPQTTLLIGLLLVVLAGLYFLYLKIRKQQVYKAYLAAFVYSSGIMVAPLSQLDGFTTELLYLFTTFFLLALVNLMLIPLYEVKMDEDDAQPSMPIRKGIHATEHKIRIALIINFMVVAGYGYHHTLSLVEGLVLLLMPMVLFILLFSRTFFAKCYLYRILADGIFFLPGLSLLVAHPPWI